METTSKYVNSSAGRAAACPAEIKSRADLVGQLLDLPASGDGETLLNLFCRLHNLQPPRRARAVFDALVEAEKARSFSEAVVLVSTWLKSWPGVEIVLEDIAEQRSPA